MNDFTASNGVHIVLDQAAGNTVVRVSKGGLVEEVFGTPRVAALREFFRAEEDERLGRWRWPENPEYVVYPHRDGQARVLHEPTGSFVFRYRGEDVELRKLRATSNEAVMPATEAAAAYFDAHPEPKLLPTQPGLYMGALLGDFPTIWSRNGDGRWYLINTGSLFPIEDGHIQKYLPFTPLHPEVTS